MKLLIGAGGTGGHIIPALAIALELSSRGWEIAFIGNKNSMEETIVKKNNFQFNPIHVQKLYRKITLEHIKFPIMFLKSTALCISHLVKFKPDAILCTGGFVSGPVALSGIILRKRLYFQDGNSYPGLTTRLMAKYAEHIFISSNQAVRLLKKADCVLTGNPILKYTKIERKNLDWNELNLRTDSKKLFIIGGSQGSEIINRVIYECVERLLALNIDIIWQTGKSHLLKIRKKIGTRNGIHCFDFTDKMSDYYQMSDLAISRAGALSIAELEEHKIPTIYIPLPTSAENHQLKNALAQYDKGVGMILEQKILTPQQLITSIQSLLDRYLSFKDKLESLPPNNATQTIADIIEQESQLT